MIKAGNNIPAIVSEYFLKDGRSVSVFKKDGKITGWKRYNNIGSAIFCEAQYKTDKDLAGVAKYDAMGRIKSFLRINSAKSSNGNIITLKKIFVDFINSRKNYKYKILRKNLNGKLYCDMNAHCYIALNGLSKIKDKEFFKGFKL